MEARHFKHGKWLLYEEMNNIIYVTGFEKSHLNSTHNYESLEIPILII